MVKKSLYILAVTCLYAGLNRGVCVCVCVRVCVLRFYLVYSTDRDHK